MSRCGAVQSRGTSIVMMEAAKYGKRDHLASERWSPRTAGEALAHALLWSGAIEMADVLGEHCEQMALAQDDNVIAASGPSSSSETTTVSSVPTSTAPRRAPESTFFGRPFKLRL